MQLSREARLVAGVIVLTVPTIMYGGLTLLGILTKGMAGLAPDRLALDDTQWALFRAGHAHAGVWVVLSLVIQVLLDATMLPTRLTWLARISAPVAAVGIAGGFFGLAFLPVFRWLLYFRGSEPRRLSGPDWRWVGAAAALTLTGLPPPSLVCWRGTTAIWLTHCVPKPLHQVLQQTAAALLVLRGFKPLAWPPLLSCIASRGCLTGVDSRSNRLSKFVAIDEESNHEIMHVLRLGEAQRAADQLLARVRRLMCWLSLFCGFSLPT